MSESVVMTMEQIQQLVDAAVKKQSIILKGEIVELTEKLRDKNTEKGVINLPDDDLLDEPVFYFACEYKHVMGGYTQRNGKEIFPPSVDKFVSFGNYVNNVRHLSNGSDETDCVSVYKTYSKAMVKFIEGHIEFNTVVHKKAAQALNTDKSIADIAMHAKHSLSGMTKTDIQKRARELSIPISTDTDEMIKGITDKLVDSELERRKKTGAKQFETLPDDYQKKGELKQEHARQEHASVDY